MHPRHQQLMYACMPVQDEQGYPGTFEEFILDSGLDVEAGGLQPVEFDDSQVGACVHECVHMCVGKQEFRATCVASWMQVVRHNHLLKTCHACHALC
jgi:hypothetical protein